MPLVKNQLKRLICLVAELKENRYPNAQSFSKKIGRPDHEGGLDSPCTVKTIQRDIKALKEEFGAPIEFDRERNGYYLTHMGWEFQSPILDDVDMMASVLGARIAEQVMPDPVKGMIRNAVNSALTTNYTGLDDEALIRALVVAPGLKVEIDPAIFGTVFRAWQEHRTLQSEYQDVKGQRSSLKINPHTLVLHSNAWYIKGENADKGVARTYAIHRLRRAELTNYRFEPNPKLVADTEKGDVFAFSHVHGAKIWVSKNIACYVEERHKLAGDRITQNSDGSLIVELSPMPEHELTRWILSEGGNAAVIEPQWLSDKITAAAQQTIKTAKEVLKTKRS